MTLARPEEDDGIRYLDSWRNATDPSDTIELRTILDYGPGLHRDVPEGIYHARVPGVVSKHALDLVRRSPAHYKAWVDQGDVDDTTKEAFAFGKGFHCATLEPERFATDYVVAPDFGDCRKKENKAARDLWREQNKDAVWLPHDDHEAFLGMAAAIRRHPVASRLLEDGEAEVTLRWTDADTGLECKARPDFYKRAHRTAVDLKTAENASEQAFAKDAAAYGYHRQQALYSDGFEAIGAPLEHFVFIAVEKRAPFAVAVYVLDEEAVAKGRASIRAAMADLAEAVERDHYRAYAEGIRVLSLPAWAA